MPKKTTLIIAAVVVLAIVAVLALIVFKKSPQTPQGSAVSQPAAQNDESVTRGSIKDLLASGKSQTCTINNLSDTTQTTGTIYVSGKNFRGDFTIKDKDNKEMDSHMIQDGQYSYFWSSAAPQGTKMKLETAVETPPASSPATQDKGVDLNKDVEYKCSAWTVDNLKFELPSNIQFMDLSSLTPKTQTTQPQTTNPQTSVCDQFQDSQAKAVCLSTLSGTK